MITTRSPLRCVALVAFLSLTAGLGAAPARGDVVLLTHPDASWSLRLDLPGYAIKPPRMLRDRSQVWTVASSKETGANLTAFVEKQIKLHETSECRDYYVKKVAAAKK